MSTPETPPPVAVTEDRTVAILSYITIIGFIVAIVIHGNKKTRLGAYHLRQMLGLILVGIVGGVAASVMAVIPILGWMIFPLVWLALLALWIIGLIAAVNGQLKPVPVLGEHFQKWFGSAFD